MIHERHEDLVLVVDGLPVIAVHLGVVEILTLRAPRVTEYLGPLGLGVDDGLEPIDIERAIAGLGRLISGYNAPLTAVGVIEKLLVIGGDRVEADALDHGCRLPG